MYKRDEDMSKIKVSVIVPVYKIEEQLLRHCLTSLINQSEKAAEFIVVDDGSPDQCGAIIDEFAKKDKRIIPVHTENLGVSNARNVGLSQASGDYIIFVDGDDYVENDLCEKTSAAMEKADTDILFFMHQATTESTVSFEHDETIEKISESLLKQLTIGVVSQENPVAGMWAGPPWGKVYKRSIIEENNLQFVLGLKKSQDRVFVFDYLLKTKSAAIYKYIGYHYVINETSVCQKYNKNIVPILEMAGSEFEKRIATLQNKEDYIRACDTMYMIFFCEYMMLNFFNSDNKSNFFDKIKMMKQLLKDEKYIKALKFGELNVISRKRRLIILAARHRLYVVAGVFAELLL